MCIEKVQKDLNRAVKWRSFQLHPRLYKDGIAISELMNTQSEKVRSYMQSLAGKAEDLGLPFGQPENAYNTRLAHELGQWAESMGKRQEFDQSVFKACLVDNINIAEKSVLFKLAQSAGLPGKEASDVLDKRAFARAVDQDLEDAKKLDIQAVPTLLCNGRRLVGFHPYEKIAQWLKGGFP